MRILGISCHYHDAAAALLVDGVLVAAAEEERFTRRKHDSGFPTRAIEFCLRQAGIEAADLDHLVFYEKPLLKFERILLTSMANFPRSWRTFGEAMVGWFGDKLWIRSRIQEQLDLPADRILFADHHAAHAASAFFCSPFEEAAILTVDGVGEWTTTATGTATADWGGAGTNALNLDREITFPDSLGLLYSAFTAYLGFEVNEGEYKVMGMAPYGEPRYLDEVAKVVDVRDDGSFRLDPRFFSYQHSAERTFSDRFVQLFGPAREPESDFVTAGMGPSGVDEATLRANQRYADVAASIQRTTEEILLRNVRALHARTGQKRLCMAGGVALNSVANGRILREGPFEEVFIQPAAGDAGGAVGAALYAWHVLLGKPRRYVMEHAYLGEGWSDGAIRDYLEAEGIPHREYEDEAALTDRLVAELVDGRVVGAFHGRFEWGPRALGNRSILADPRGEAMKDTVNRKIKFREPFRPFAPVVPEHRAASLFEGLPEGDPWYLPRFMLGVLPWKAGAGERVSAVNHGGTGRLQTVRREWHPRYYALVESFGQATGVPVLLNTSFNLRGEPVVASPSDAMRTFTNSGIDVLWLSRFLVDKHAL